VKKGEAVSGGEEGDVKGSRQVELREKIRGLNKKSLRKTGRRRSYVVKGLWFLYHQVDNLFLGRVFGDRSSNRGKKECDKGKKKRQLIFFPYQDELRKVCKLPTSDVECT